MVRTSQTKALMKMIVNFTFCRSLYDWYSKRNEKNCHLTNFTSGRMLDIHTILLIYSLLISIGPEFMMRLNKKASRWIRKFANCVPVVLLPIFVMSRWTADEVSNWLHQLSHFIISQEYWSYQTSLIIISRQSSSLVSSSLLLPFGKKDCT